MPEYPNLGKPPSLRDTFKVTFRGASENKGRGLGQRWTPGEGAGVENMGPAPPRLERCFPLPVGTLPEPTICSHVAGSPQEPLSAGLGLAEPFPGPVSTPCPCERDTTCLDVIDGARSVGRSLWEEGQGSGRPGLGGHGAQRSGVPRPEGLRLLLTSGLDRTARKAPKGHSPITSVRPRPRPG